MLKLCGFAVSNYHNKVKLALLEKGVPFEESAVAPSQDDAMLKRSPLGKIPFLETDEGPLSESQAILEFLEDKFPDRPLYPADPFGRAKCREIIQHLELNVELIARRLYGEAFFGDKATPAIREEVKGKVEKGLVGFCRLIKFTPYAAGAGFTAADCAVWPHLGVMSLAWERLFGEDLLRHVPGSQDYMATMAQRPEVIRVSEDRDNAMAAFLGKAQGE